MDKDGKQQRGNGIKSYAQLDERDTFRKMGESSGYLPSFSSLFGNIGNSLKENSIGTRMKNFVEEGKRSGNFIDDSKVIN